MAIGVAGFFHLFVFSKSLDKILRERISLFLSFFMCSKENPLMIPSFEPCPNLPLKKTISHQVQEIKQGGALCHKSEAWPQYTGAKLEGGQASKKAGRRISPCLLERSRGTTEDQRLECFPTTLTPQSKHRFLPSPSSPHFIPTQLTQTCLTWLCEIKERKKEKMCYKSHCIKSNKWFIAIWPETEVGKGAGWRDFASTTSAL